MKNSRKVKLQSGTISLAQLVPWIDVDGAFHGVSSSISLLCTKDRFCNITQCNYKLFVMTMFSKLKLLTSFHTKKNSSITKGKQKQFFLKKLKL